MDEMFYEILGEEVEAKDIPYTLQQAFDWGNNNEPKARFAYQLETGKLVREVGLFDHPKKRLPLSSFSRVSRWCAGAGPNWSGNKMSLGEEESRQAAGTC